jgi:alkylation response protein AidB-like acyl-CoA dehydrogenase
VYRAASLQQHGNDITREAAMAKLFASEASNRAAYKAVQIFGGYGYIKDFPVERFYRDARVTTLYEGGNSAVDHCASAAAGMRP